VKKLIVVRCGVELRVGSGNQQSADFFNKREKRAGQHQCNCNTNQKQRKNHEKVKESYMTKLCQRNKLRAPRPTQNVAQIRAIENNCTQQNQKTTLFFAK
jgi:hypothetical protein